MEERIKIEKSKRKRDGRKKPRNEERKERKKGNNKRKTYIIRELLDFNVSELGMKKRVRVYVIACLCISVPVNKSEQIMQSLL